MHAPTTSVLEFRKIVCELDAKRVVNEVSFTIGKGEIMCLMGESGCGKTTCLRLAAGMETPLSGEIFLNGELVSTPRHVVPPEQRGLGFLFQDYALFPHLSVYENICFGINKLPAAEQNARAKELLAAVGLSSYAAKYPAKLSGGEQQRVALARALAPKPQLMLMDEPFSGLDKPRRNEMRDLTRKLIKEETAAGLIVTHDFDDALRVADFVAAQKDGRIIEAGETSAIAASKMPEVRELFA